MEIELTPLEGMFLGLSRTKSRILFCHLSVMQIKNIYQQVGITMCFPSGAFGVPKKCWGTTPPPLSFLFLFLCVWGGVGVVLGYASRICSTKSETTSHLKEPYLMRYTNSEWKFPSQNR
jgi:hypothetical protein